MVASLVKIEQRVGLSIQGQLSCMSFVRPAGFLWRQVKLYKVFSRDCETSGKFIIAWFEPALISDRVFDDVKYAWLFLIDFFVTG
jgi:hypothetical protein